MLEVASSTGLSCFKRSCLKWHICIYIYKNTACMACNSVSYQTAAVFNQCYRDTYLWMIIRVIEMLSVI